MVFSSDGNKLLAVTHSGVIDVFDFNRCTGELSNHRYAGALSIDQLAANTFYGCSFSPDGTKIYVSEATNWMDGGCRLFQFDLNAPDFASSQALIYTFSTDSTQVCAHQLGPDGKIYIAVINVVHPTYPQNYHLSVIEKPDSAGLSCNFNFNGLDLKGRRTWLGLGNFPNYNLGPLAAMTAYAGRDTLLCEGENVTLGVPDVSGGKCIFLWQDMSGAGLGTGAQLTVVPVVPPGTSTTLSVRYSLTVTDTTLSGCAVTTDTVTVTVIPYGAWPQANAGADTILCASSLPLMLTLGAADTLGIWNFLWENSSGVSVGASDQYVFTPDSSEVFYLTVTNLMAPAACREARDTVSVIVETPVAVPVLPEALACPGVPVQIGMAARANEVYMWSPTTGLSAANVSDPVATVWEDMDYTLTVTDTLLQSFCKSTSVIQRVRMAQFDAGQQPSCQLPTVLSASNLSFPSGLVFPGLKYPVSLKVFDDRGRLIYTHTDYRGELRADDLHQAMYFYIVESEGVVFTRKLLIVH